MYIVFKKFKQRSNLIFKNPGYFDALMVRPLRRVETSGTKCPVTQSRIPEYRISHLRSCRNVLARLLDLFHEDASLPFADQII